MLPPTTGSRYHGVSFALLETLLLDEQAEKNAVGSCAYGTRRPTTKQGFSRILTSECLQVCLWLMKSLLGSNVVRK